MSRSAGRTTSSRGRTSGSPGFARSTRAGSAQRAMCSIRAGFRSRREAVAGSRRRWPTGRTTSSCGHTRVRPLRASGGHASIRRAPSSTRPAFRSPKARSGTGSRPLPRTAAISWSPGSRTTCPRARSKRLVWPPTEPSSIRTESRSRRQGASTSRQPPGTGRTTSSSGRTGAPGTATSTALGSLPGEPCSIQGASRSPLGASPSRRPLSRSTASTTWWPGSTTTCGSPA